jgi:uracil-DNA glycosylase
MARARATTSAANFLPAEPSLPALREAAAGCKGCDLWQLGTRTVFGEGPESAEVMFVGEQPGDQKDRAGKPFVGPAGRLLDMSCTRGCSSSSARARRNHCSAVSSV